jgi:hypothetical protein
MPGSTLVAQGGPPECECGVVVFSLMEESKNPFLLPRVSLSQYQPWTRADAVRPRVSAANHIPPQVHFDDGRACRWVSRRCGIRLLNERIPFP